jgi:hypothetical protein
MSLLKQWLLPCALSRLERLLVHGVCTHVSPSDGQGAQLCSSSGRHHLHTSSQHAASTCSDQQQAAASPSSLRSDLGSAIALGSVGSSQQNSSDIARRRESLLSHGKRFYETVQVQPCQIPADHPPSSSSGTGHGYQLLLRKYPVRTPAKKVLVLPTLSLALAVAAEWEWLPSGKPAPHRMPLTGLACTAIDQPKEPERVIEHLMKYVHTDGACVRWVALGGGAPQG